MSLCYIVGAGGFNASAFSPSENDFIIAADGGLYHLDSIGIKPSLLVGDFDSLSVAPKDIKTVKHNPIKDDTDSMLCIKEGLSRGYKDFRLFGCSDKRLDHTLANIQSLAYLAEHDAFGIIVGENENVCVVKNRSISFTDKASGFISLFSLGDLAEGINLTNLKYPLKDAVVSNSFPLCVSNEFLGKPSSIQIKNGICAVIFSCDIDFLDYSL